MKKKRTVAINNPKVRKIRDNLRALLIEWKISQWDQLNDEYIKIHVGQNGRSRHSKDYTYEEESKVTEIQRKMKILDDSLRGSICECVACGASYKDMTYNPVEKQWFCVDCYKTNQDYYKDTDEAYLYP